MADGAASVRVTESFGGVEGVALFRVVDADGVPVAGPRVAVVGHTHGNEIVGGAVARRFRERFAAHLVAGEVLLVLNNLEAMRANVRHTPDGRDMNRLWDAESLTRIGSAPVDTLCYEERRVREVAPLLQTAGYILDLHSTSRPSRPHLVFRDDLRHTTLAAKLGVRLMVTGLHESGLLGGGLCPDVGLAPGEHGERLGFTLEAGQHTDPGNTEAAWSVVVRLLAALGLWREVLAPPPRDFEVYEVIERFVQAAEGGPPYVFASPASGGARRGPPRRLESFEPIEADEVLLLRGTREVVRATAPFTMLMPAPTAGPGEDLFYYCQRRHAALQLRPETDELARQEASAIERFLDLLADDAAQRGETVVSFDGRRLLDHCAELITRVARLPAGHPHRRITVVGRGDDAVDEAEARRAKRYHQALAHALADGVPIDRIQLLRGASTAWLRTLAASAVDARHALRMFFSARHAHTVSMLVLGDPERAFAEGDFHHVRVALLVEAATVEPGEDDVRVRVTRAGMVGARPELVRVATALVDALRAEHCHLVADGALGPAAALEPLMDAEGGLTPRGPEDAEALARAVLDLQVRGWRQVLRHEVTRPQHLPDAAALRGWLVRTMCSTGILDADALRAMVVREDADGWWVDPTRLSEPVPAGALRGRSPHHVPDQVLVASDVDRNTLERWSGWKRFVREVQSIPGQRGRDLDLVFRADDIQRRLAGWLDDALALAEREPGRWQVVIAGDGLSPERDAGAASAFLQAHRRVVRHPALRYQRIQHAQGTHLTWLKDFIDGVGHRPAGGAPVSLCWEAEHGGMVNVVLVARLSDDAQPDPWTLEGWQVVRCGLVVRELHPGQGHGDGVALLTEPDERGVANQELLHFGRAHCEALLRQAGRRITGRPGPATRVALDNAVVELVSRWVAHVHDDRADLARFSDAERGYEVARRLGLLDARLAVALADAALRREPPTELARQIWQTTPPWPGASEAVS